MSLTQYAILKKADVPSREIWQESINQLGYKLTLDPDLKPFEDSGFIPCQLNDKETGFEISYDDIINFLYKYPHLKNKCSGKDYCIEFNWEGDLNECMCVLITSLALQTNCNAIIYYPHDDLIFYKDQLINEINKCSELQE